MKKVMFVVLALSVIALALAGQVQPNNRWPAEFTVENRGSDTVYIQMEYPYVQLTIPGDETITFSIAKAEYDGKVIACGVTKSTHFDLTQNVHFTVPACERLNVYIRASKLPFYDPDTGLWYTRAGRKSARCKSRSFDPEDFVLLKAVNQVTINKASGFDCTFDLATVKNVYTLCKQRRGCYFNQKFNNGSIETKGLQLLRKTVFGENPNPSERNRGNPKQVHESQFEVGG
jgi:hypothetical protein